MSKITVFEQGNLCIDYEILTRQHTEFKFKDGKVEYFSISTQWDVADTIEEAIKNILEADKKYDGKVPLAHCNSKPIVLLDDIEDIMKEAERVIMTPLYLL